jgi:hypothetical protein
MKSKWAVKTAAGIMALGMVAAMPVNRADAATLSALAATTRLEGDITCLRWLNAGVGLVRNTCGRNVTLVLPLPVTNPGFKTVQFSAKRSAAGTMSCTAQTFDTNGAGSSSNTVSPSGNDVFQPLTTSAVNVLPGNMLILSCDMSGSSTSGIIGVTSYSP